jgi:asparagine synthase (glutamine-hydrolysing)
VLRVYDEPTHTAANEFWIEALMEAAHQRGVGVLLTGQSGNAIISWTGVGENLLPALLDGDIAGFWSTFETSRHDAGLGRWRAVRRFLLKPPIWSLRYQIRKRWPPLRNSWQDFSALNPDFVREIKLNQHMAEAGHIFNARPPDPLKQRLRIIRPGRSVTGGIWLETGSAYGMEVRDPTQDRRVMELCLAIPNEQFQRGGENRKLIRHAMQGYLPDAVRLNTRIGLQAADLGQRVLENRDEIETVIAEMEQHDLTRQVLDIPRMRNVLTSLEHGLTPQNTTECSEILMRGLMAGLFLLRF